MWKPAGFHILVYAYWNIESFLTPCAYAKGNSIVHQLIDLALLQNGMLKGEALDRFLKRSVDLIK